ncbi:MAG: hypothetical protein JGK17_02430 [Microcoleus sp. PH2017_10_PVI_O_A]|uniref:hypothetical protein n=1 Tax=unclassified Microcoleus TaxID=2642155 RepID=UPI001E11430B|nr:MULTISPECIES: hypothetical protein [unclassified Microcoleus]TAE79403.1 MAG: hypothetical protein EAZ83_21580 [Oscillatoriales cyanobacterium]MCC3404443.1 hypothetical protein [Microcoleus sp. PH2017_10_PVI_O_A]MCC3458531.1 hypothetical protein [Microcoleus sp. PH2017_11_PCY_U_A]MCC3477211.1 hypothetical protein [Microcoleus sp. PH2017_12_PCY_D_A]MCC3529896.1 hypothetical protein [Microcoleus sp. PH2017_21_RUC_O_A]
MGSNDVLFKPVQKIDFLRLAHVLPVSVINYSCTIAPMNVRQLKGSIQTLQDGCCEIAMKIDRAIEEGVQ